MPGQLAQNQVESDSYRFRVADDGQSISIRPPLKGGVKRARQDHIMSERVLFIFGETFVVLTVLFLLLTVTQHKYTRRIQVTAFYVSYSVYHIIFYRRIVLLRICIFKFGRIHS
jgi:hypothetical protein